MRIWIAAAAAALVSICLLASSAGAQVLECGPILKSVAPIQTCPAPPPCPEPLGFTQPATGTTLNGRVFQWTGDLQWFFEYGPLPRLYTGRTPVTSAPAATGEYHVSAAISPPGGPVYFRLVVINCSDNVLYGDELRAGGAAAADVAPADESPGDSATTDPAVTADEPATAEVATSALPRVAPAVATPKPKKAKKIKKGKKAKKHRRHR